ncbi:hypothetical protein NECAME_16176 [Necator americanus]|uniref:Uncharacterized protein n=1 Tax=Necator americanus TaxID=51031 RepID=W2TXA1_NECAM|nr:hypothetical protein NECAME_16176 [Necator americanus]ETN86720.1 hypothetical protein NECAME_16176 [Necator americanus]
MSDEDVLKTVDEVCEDETDTEDEGERGEPEKGDEPSEEYVVTEQIEPEAQQAQAEVVAERVKQARRDADRVEPARAEGRDHPEASVREPAGEREQWRQQLRAEQRNAQQERDDLRFMLQELERQPTCPERRYSHADVRPFEQGIHMLCVLLCNPAALRRLLQSNNGRESKETLPR